MVKCVTARRGLLFVSSSSSDAWDMLGEGGLQAVVLLLCMHTECMQTGGTLLVYFLYISFLTGCALSTSPLFSVTACMAPFPHRPPLNSSHPPLHRLALHISQVLRDMLQMVQLAVGEQSPSKL
jgi:hypothetical protein